MPRINGTRERRHQPYYDPLFHPNTLNAIEVLKAPKPPWWKLAARWRRWRRRTLAVKQLSAPYADVLGQKVLAVKQLSERLGRE